jgi:hypothetical protein
MPRFLLSAHSVEGAPRKPMSEAEMREMGARVRALEDEMSSAGALVLGGRLLEPRAASVVRVASGETVVTDGPFAETKEHLGGFYVIDAEDLSGAQEWAARTAACVDTAIEVRPFWEPSVS